MVGGEVMPKKVPYPRLRSHTGKGKAGQIWTSWYWDGRPDGEKDTPLGNDYDAAIAKWKELNAGAPKIAGTIQEAFTRWREEVLPEYTSAETKKGYGRNLTTIEAWAGQMTWDAVTLPMLKKYLQKRTAKTQGNRELSVMQIVWNWARTEGLTKLPWPAAGMEKSKWKNKEFAREIEVSDDLFAAIYAEAIPPLRNCMDLASATGMRLTDCRLIQMPPAGTLSKRASKNGKYISIDALASPVLSNLVAERKRLKPTHLMLLTTPTGRPVSARMLRDWWDDARAKAAAKPGNRALKDEIEALYLRDMRKRAAQLAEDLTAASKLLQHSSEAITERHYRRGDKLRPVR